MMPQRWWTMLSMLIFVGAAHGAVPFFNPIQRKMLEEGKVLVTNLKPTGGDGVAALAMAVVKAPVAKVWPVIRDCHRYQEFMPRAKRTGRTNRVGNRAVCELEISLPFPLSNLKSKVNSVESQLKDGGRRRAWTLKEGTYKRNTGSWTIHPWDTNPEWTLLVYKIDVEPDNMIPDSFMRKAQASTLPDTLKAVRKRAMR